MGYILMISAVLITMYQLVSYDSTLITSVQPQFDKPQAQARSDSRNLDSDDVDDV